MSPVREVPRVDTRVAVSRRIVGDDFSKLPPAAGGHAPPRRAPGLVADAETVVATAIEKRDDDAVTGADGLAPLLAIGSVTAYATGRRRRTVGPRSNRATANRVRLEQV